MPRRRTLTLSLFALLIAAAVLPTALAGRGTTARVAWRHPTRVELKNMRNAIDAWACQAHPHCRVAVPASNVRVAKTVDPEWGVVYATAVVILNPRTSNPQGGANLLSRDATVPANRYHGAERGSPWWSVFGASPYGGAKVDVATWARIQSAACRKIERQLQATPDGC